MGGGGFEEPVSSEKSGRTRSESQGSVSVVICCDRALRRRALLLWWYALVERGILIRGFDGLMDTEVMGNEGFMQGFMMGFYVI